MPEKKIAIVCSGGGMRCAYAGGALVALAKVYNFTSPDIMIAASGSAAFALYYLAGQYEAIRHIACELLSTPRFISYPRLRKIMDIDYLIDTVFKNQEPLDTEKLRQATSRYYIAVTDAREQKTRYVSHEDRLDPFEVLRATKAIPFFFRKKVVLQGREYIDGECRVSFPQLIQKARELGATRIIAIHSWGRKDFATAYKGTEVTLIASPSLPARLLTRNAQRLTETFEKGYQDVARHPEIGWIFAKPLPESKL